jgi:hypothetical protein
MNAVGGRFGLFSSFSFFACFFRGFSDWKARYYITEISE